MIADARFSGMLLQLPPGEHVQEARRHDRIHRAEARSRPNHREQDRHPLHARLWILHGLVASTRGRSWSLSSFADGSGSRMAGAWRSSRLVRAVADDLVRLTGQRRLQHALRQARPRRRHPRRHQAHESSRRNLRLHLQHRPDLLPPPPRLLCGRRARLWSGREDEDWMRSNERDDDQEQDPLPEVLARAAVRRDAQYGQVLLAASGDSLLVRSLALSCRPSFF